MQAFMTKLAMAAMLLGGAVGAQAAACPVNYSTSPAQAAFPQNGGYGQFHVSVPAGCVWSVAPMYGWVVITSGASFNGSGTVTYYVSPNAGATRENFLWVSSSTPGPNGSNVRGRLMLTQK
jgi:hypothetical protein